MATEDRTFKVTLNTSRSKPIKTKMNKTDSNVEVRINTNTVESEDTYYDEIYYYDGGGVEGYGD